MGSLATPNVSGDLTWNIRETFLTKVPAMHWLKREFFVWPLAHFLFLVRKALFDRRIALMPAASVQLFASCGVCRRTDANATDAAKKQHNAVEGMGGDALSQPPGTELMHLPFL